MSGQAKCIECGGTGIRLGVAIPLAFPEFIPYVAAQFPCLACAAVQVSR